MNKVTAFCDLPEENKGCVATFRRPRGDESKRILQLRKIEEDALYELDI